MGERYKPLSNRLRHLLTRAHATRSIAERAQRQAAGDQRRRAIQCIHTTPLVWYTRTATWIAACSPAYNHSNGIFTSARSPVHARRSLGERNPTEPRTPLEFIPASEGAKCIL